jgi:RNase P subunit RPR2
MIRIIKQGELNKDIKKFTCKYCKAEFEADSEDFKVVFTPYNDLYYVISCPCCHHILFVEAEQYD